RPWKWMWLAPLWAESFSVPATSVRVQRRLRLLSLFWATHLPWTLRPARRWVKARVTVAGSLRSNENTVPIGGFRCRAIDASLLPSRQTEADWVRPVIDGGGSCAVRNVAV